MAAISIMDERENVLERVQDTGVKDDNVIDSASDLKRPRNDLIANGSSKAEIPSHSLGDLTEIQAQGTEKGSSDTDCLKAENLPNRISEESCNFEAGVSFHPSASRDTSKHGPSSTPNDEEVLDISPTGYSLSTLDSFVEEEPHKILQVRKMYIFDNKFTVLPTSVSKLRNLKSLKIFSNEVRLLPEEIGDIAQLERLQLKVCPTSLGSMPPLGNLRFLKTLELHQTPLRPSIFSLPPDISKLQLLTRLAVCNFSISFLPPEIGELKSLEELDISFNRLKVLPREVSSLMALKHLRAENNKLIELPPGLGSLPKLSYIDVAHNKLTSLEPLGLSAMTSLRALDAKFNKLQNTVEIPVWITCNLEGNPSSVGQITSSSDADALDSELLPSAAEGDEVSSHAPTSLHFKETVVQKNSVHGKNKRGWRRHDVHQLKARQDRLNMSRKSKAECREGTQAELDDVMERGSALLQERFEENEAVRLLDSGFHEELLGDESETNSDEKVGREGGSRHDKLSAGVIEGSNGSRRSKKDVLSANTFPAFIEDGDFTPVKGGPLNDSNSSRKVISGDRCIQQSNKHRPDDASIVDHERESVETFIFKSKEELEHALVSGRRKVGRSDRNPNPRKRRKSAQAFSEVSYMYRSESLCGFADRLQDGFYDAGRERAFSSLEMLETEEPCFSSREVILVDRERDEELDVIAVSAQHFLTVLELAGRNVGHGEYSGLNAFQKAAILSLYVSDCFGGSDKSLNVTNTRRAALGGSFGAPFVCSCSSSSRLTSFTESSSSFQGTIPTVHVLCEGAVRLLKMQRQSNIVPLGSLPYGVCRHRAILFKYLCDRASIPCELVRGYLDYVPHAWNVILVRKESDEVRMLVDACRPLDIREEEDSEYFCRYIPLRRFHFPSLNRTELSVIQSKDLIPVLHEEIGRGASGSVVRRCSLGTVTAAAKVRLFDQTNEALYKDMESRCLSELRILCSLGEHPHIISFYGHQISSVPVTSVDSKQGSEAVQLMIFMDYFQGGSLETAITRYAKEGRMYMPAKEAAYVAKDVVHALSFIHSKGIIHRDIKSSNVLVEMGGNEGDSTISVKLCDFDSAVPLLSSSAHTCYLAHRGVPSLEVCVGTPRWMAPEVFNAMYSRHPYGLEADIWSFGCLLLEMLTLAVPYAGRPESQIQSHIQTGQRPQLSSEIENLVSEVTSEGNQANINATISDEELKILKVLVGLFKSCTESRPHSRPSSLEVYNTLSMILESDSIGGSKNISNTEVLKERPTSHSLEGSCLENSVTSLDASEQHEGKLKRLDRKDVISFVDKPEEK